MNIINDNTIQLQTSSLNAGILANQQVSQFSLYTPLTTFNAPNTVYTTAIGLKQNTLIATCNLLEIGSAITALDYNNITLNKPTNFQADWNSTVINKPNLSIYQPLLTFNSPLTQSGHTISLDISLYDTITARNTAITTRPRHGGL